MFNEDIGDHLGRKCLGFYGALFERIDCRESHKDKKIADWCKTGNPPPRDFLLRASAAEGAAEGIDDLG